MRNFQLTIVKLASAAAKMVCMGMTNLHRSKVSIWVTRRHAHARIHWRRGCRTVWRTSWARIILATAPGKTDTRIADRIALHLVDGHLGRVALDELDKPASLSRWDLDIGDLTKALEERAKLVLGNIARETADKDGGVVRVGELIHGLRSAVVADWRIAHGIHAAAHLTAGSWLSATHTARSTTHATRATTGFVLWGCGRDAHGTVAAVNTLHLLESVLLIRLVRKAYKAVPTGHA